MLDGFQPDTRTLDAEIMPRPQSSIERDHKIIELCIGGATTLEVAQALKITDKLASKLLKQLQKSGEIYTIIPEQERRAGGGTIYLYIKTGTEPTRKAVQQKPVEEVIVDPRINHEFIRCSHRVLQVWAR